MTNESIANKRFTRTDLGLAVLRTGAGLSLVGIFGWRKFIGAALLIYSGRPWASYGLGPLIQQMGFPAAGLLGIYVEMSESIFALLVACGFLTRLMSLLVTLSMTGALYFSLKNGEEPLRAALYVVTFGTLLITGPGRFSIDYFWQSRVAAKRLKGIRVLTRTAVTSASLDRNINIGMLVLRTGIGVCAILFFALKQSAASETFTHGNSGFWLLSVFAICAALATFGLLTRLASGIAVVTWLWAVFAGFHSGENLGGLPARAIEYAIAFAPLLFIGPGKYSIDFAIEIKQETGSLFRKLIGPITNDPLRSE